MTTVSRYRGVTYDRLYRRWNAHITVNGRRIFIGAFDIAEAAAEAYDIAAAYHHGDKAKLNFVSIEQELAT